MPQITVNILGSDTSLEDLRADVVAAKAKGLARERAFTPETVLALIEKIEELSQPATPSDLYQQYIDQQIQIAKNLSESASKMLDLTQFAIGSSPNNFRIIKWDSGTLEILRIGEKVFTKYGETLVISGFEGDDRYLVKKGDDSEVSYPISRIAYVCNPE